MFSLPRMRTAKDVEAYLDRLGRAYRATDEGGTFVLEGARSVPIALRVDPPLVVLRANVGKVPTDRETVIFRRLLELNASSLVHSSYGIIEDNIHLGSALALENLDLNELQAALDEIEMALAQQAPSLFELSRTNS